MGKYDPLQRFLRRCRSDDITLTFSEIERIIGGFLPHAAEKPAWWSNVSTARRGFVQCGAWLEAGYHAVAVDPVKTVCFSRRPAPTVPDEAGRSHRLDRRGR